MEGKTLFEATGSRTGADSTAVMTLVVLGVIGSLAMGIAAFAAPKMVGSPLIYVATFVASIALGVWIFKRDAVTIRIIVRDDGLRAVIRGPAVAIDELLELGTVHWVTFDRVPIRMGGGFHVLYSVTVETKRGRTLGFTLRAGGKGSEPADWPVRDAPLREGRDVFTCFGIRKLVDALYGSDAIDGAAEGQRGSIDAVQ